MYARASIRQYVIVDRHDCIEVVLRRARSSR